MDKIDDPRLSVHVVWTPVLENDDYRSSIISQHLISDARTTHYWDGEMALGAAFGKDVVLPNGRDFAWDIYFAFDDEARWRDRVPKPAGFAHQLGLDERYLGDGVRLRKMVVGLLAELD